MARPRIGLALGSGSARGWAHIGVIDALVEAGIEPNIICGSSMGALVGAAFVTDRLEALREWAEAATRREIVSLLDIRFFGGGLIEGKQIVEFLRGMGIASSIEKCRRPYVAVATDMVTGREVWLKTGPIEDAVRASIALPGIFSPVRIDRRWLLDGGLVNPVPVSACRALGAEFIIAVNLNDDILHRRFDSEPEALEVSQNAPKSDEDFSWLMKQSSESIRRQALLIAQKLLTVGPNTPSYFEVIATSINIMQDQITRARLAGEPPHVMLLPRLRNIGLLEFHRAKEAIAEGRAIVEQSLPSIRRNLDRATISLS